MNRELSSTSPLIATETQSVAAAGGATAVARDPEVEAAQRELDDLLLRDTDNHPDVIAARARLAALKASAAKSQAEALAAPRAPTAPTSKIPSSMAAGASGGTAGAVDASKPAPEIAPADGWPAQHAFPAEPCL